MVTTITNLGRNGVADWVIQRLTSVVLMAYTVFIVGFLVLNPDLDYGTWRGLFDQLWVRIFSLFTLVSIVAHGWIGLWSVLHDYVTEQLIGKKALALRMIALSIYAIVVIAYLVWGVEVLWGNSN